MGMERHVTNGHLLRDTARIFRESSSIYSAPTDYPNFFPRRYFPYGLNEAALDALIDNGYTAEELARSITLINKMADTALQAFPGYHETYKERERVANILNRMEEQFSEPG